jgi:branched-chain amino acid aminotransferase
VAQSRDELKALLREFVRRNGVADSGIRITLTGGDSKDGHTIGRPNLVIAQRPLPDNKAINERGIRLMTVAHQRQFPEAKTLDYLMSIWMQPTMREKGADDILYHQDGNISECPRSNIFIVTGDDRVVTPAKNILRGVIREKVLQMAREGLASEERDVSLDEVRRAKEVFMTSTTKNIIPVVAIDGAAVGTGRPGAVTLRIGKLLVARITEEVTNHPGRV